MLLIDCFLIFGITSALIQNRQKVPRPVTQPVKPQKPPRKPPQKPPTKPPQKPPKKEFRNILFTYRNSRPKEVYVIGDFNGWRKVDKMKKGKNHTWKLAKKLAPGYYRYKYWVDGRKIRDPNNKRVDANGNSYIRLGSLKKKRK